MWSRVLAFELGLIRQTPFAKVKGRRYSPILLVTEDKYDSDVGSSYPGAGEGPKGMAVRHLKRYASWVQTVVRQVGLLSTAGVDF